MITKKRKITNILTVIIIIVAISFGVLFYFKISNLKNNSGDKKEKQRVENLLKEKSSLLLKISEIYNFPDGEDPTIATVSDPAALVNKIPFTNSQIGDKVLFFPGAGKVVLYRPSINKIIDIAAVQKSN